MSIQVIFLMFQNIFLFSYGIFSMQSMDTGKLRAILGYFKMPVMYAMILGIGLNALDLPIPGFIWVPANYIDRKSTRLNSSHVAHLVCRLLLEKKKQNKGSKQYFR